MKNALQEQLLKAGLATEKQINKANAAINKGKKQAPRKPKNQRGKQESDLAKAYTARQKVEKEEHAEKQRLAAQKKAHKALIDALIRDNTQNRKEADIAHQFLVGSNIKRVFVTSDQKTQLQNGLLGIVFRKSARCIISREIADKILALDPNKTLFINALEDTLKTDDDYAEFEIPDDLDW